MSVNRTSVVGGVFVLALALAAAAKTLYRSRHKASPSGKSLPLANDEYKRIMQRYFGADSAMALSGTIHIYDGEKGNSLLEKSSFYFAHGNGQSYSQLSHLQTFCNGTVQLQMDTVSKVVAISKMSLVDNKKAPGPVMLDKFFSDGSSTHLLGELTQVGSERTLVFNSGLPPAMKSFAVSYDTADYRLKKAEVAFWKNFNDMDPASGKKVWLARIDYVYSRPVRLDMDTRIYEIVLLDSGKISLRPRYADYQLNAAH